MLRDASKIPFTTKGGIFSEETLSEADIQMYRHSDYQNTVHYEADYQQTSSIDYRTVHYEVSDAAYRDFVTRTVPDVMHVYRPTAQLTRRRLALVQRALREQP